MSQKNNNDPGPEVRQKIVDNIMAKVEAKEPKPDRDQAELNEMNRHMHAIKNRVYALIRPIIEAAQMRSPVDPACAHTEKGRILLMMQAQRMYLEELRTMNREEALYLLSLAWAEFTLNDFL
jgi:hypothetical protein